VRWYDGNTSSAQLLATGLTFTTPVLNATTVYFVRSYNSQTGCSSFPKTAAAVLQQEVVWYADFDGDGLGDPATATAPTCEQPDDYVGNSNDQCPLIFSKSNQCSYDPAELNYVYTRAYQVEGATESNDIPFFDASDNLIQSISYIDGMGRLSQQIAIDQSPNKNDIITHAEYDGFGRSQKQYLPYAATDDQLAQFRLDAKIKTFEHYDTDKYDNTANPFSETLFEVSHLNRPKKQAAPGEDWAMGNGHEIETQYMTNTLTDIVKQYEVSLSFANNKYTPSLVLRSDNGGNYGEGELTKTILFDENNNPGELDHSVEEFTNKSGQLILKRNYNNDDPHDTYYVYDDFGNLSYVLPPLIDASTATLTDINNTLDDLAYQYIYDHRNRLIEKQIPGKDVEYIVYNRSDQPVMTQDANQRLINEWLYTKYDGLGRVAYTGKAVIDDTILNIRNQAKADGQTYVSNDLTPALGTDGTVVPYGNESYPSANITEVLTINYYDDYNFNLAGAPASVSPFNEDNDIRVKGLATGGKVRVLDVPGPNNWITSVSYYDAKARPIYTYTKNDFLGTTDIVESKLDFLGRPLKTRTTHTRNGNTIVTLDNFTYDHVGRLLAQTQCIGDETLGNNCDGAGGGSAQNDLVLSNTINNNHVATNSIVVQPNATIVPTSVLSIDPNATVGSGEAELIVLNSYDELGRLDYKKVGGDADATDVLNSIGLQTVNYDYNVRNWLRSINNPNAMGDDLFAFDIKYNDVGDPSRKLYNGNISQTVWNSANNAIAGNPPSRNYVYTYDALNRITGATGAPNTNYNVSGIIYDKNGNIERLKREGHTAVDNNGLVTTYGVMDDLKYTYAGNKLQAVDDHPTASATQGFMDGAEQETEYIYDANGNMISDLNKGITAITYNHLNLPKQVTINGNGNNGNIQYVYDSKGRKLKKTVSTIGVETLYANGYVYEGNTLQFFRHTEGYVSAENGIYKYVYEYKDHLNNTRLSYTDANSDGNITSNEIIKESNYYPFGLSHKGYNNNVSSLGNSIAKKYMFGGKEYQSELRLGWYDVTARNYDPAIGRWMNLDPLSEKMRRHSPYSYAFNNPLRFMDPDGMAPTDIILRGSNNSSITIVTDIVNIDVDASGIVGDLGGNYSLEGEDILVAALDVAGIVDPTGVADAAAAGIEFKNGNIWAGIASGLGIIAYFGDIAKVGKIPKHLKTFKKAISSVKKGKKKSGKIYKVP